MSCHDFSEFSVHSIKGFRTHRAVPLKSENPKSVLIGFNVKSSQVKFAHSAPKVFLLINLGSFWVRVLCSRLPFTAPGDLSCL